MIRGRRNEILSLGFGWILFFLEGDETNKKKKETVFHCGGFNNYYRYIRYVKIWRWYGCIMTWYMVALFHTPNIEIHFGFIPIVIDPRRLPLLTHIDSVLTIFIHLFSFIISIYNGCDTIIFLITLLLIIIISDDDDQKGHGEIVVVHRYSTRW